jgi:hypothetical protein
MLLCKRLLHSTNSRPVAVMLRLRNLEHDALSRHASRGATIAPIPSNTKSVVPNTAGNTGLLVTSTHILPIHDRRSIARSFASTHIDHFILYLNILFFCKSFKGVRSWICGRTIDWFRWRACIQPSCGRSPFLNHGTETHELSCGKPWSYLFYYEFALY